jgi:hypothetical protein
MKEIAAAGLFAGKVDASGSAQQLRYPHCCIHHHHHPLQQLELAWDGFWMWWQVQRGCICQAWAICVAQIAP